MAYCPKCEEKTSRKKVPKEKLKRIVFTVLITTIISYSLKLLVSISFGVNVLYIINYPKVSLSYLLSVKSIKALVTLWMDSIYPTDGVSSTPGKLPPTEIVRLKDSENF